jgi:hypothetical protein
MVLMVCVVAGCGASSDRVPPDDAAAINNTLTAVFVHPEPSQCTGSMSCTSRRSLA